MNLDPLLEKHSRCHDPERWRLAKGILSHASTLGLPEQRRAILMMDLAINPVTPTDVLAWLATATTFKAILTRVAEHNNTSQDTLSTLAKIACAEVRAAVAGNQNTNQETLLELAVDDNPDVRYTIAERYDLPTFLLEKVAQDENPYVAFRATKTQKRLADDAYRREHADSICVDLNLPNSEDDDFSCRIMAG